jgi:uncharacterized protein
MRPIWLIIGLLALALGALGVVLPLLPTTVFLLVAAYAFARSSPRLHAWLLGHRLFGPLILNWQRNRSIPRPAKVAAVASSAAVIGGSWLVGVSALVLVIQATVLTGVMSFVLTRPDA